jgi:hypothetical protein
MIRQHFIELLDQLNAADREARVWDTKIFIGKMLNQLNSEDQSDTVCWLLELRRRGLS